MPDQFRHDGTKWIPLCDQCGHDLTPPTGGEALWSCWNTEDHPSKMHLLFMFFEEDWPDYQDE